mgnify:CR=1 FL=1|tara:strand:+ start:519 stop:989 length:471 start_codon:yes stop_codon:yes gene_type:complete
MFNILKNIKARRMNKIVNEVTRQIEEVINARFDHAVEQLNEVDVDYSRVASHLCTSDIAYNLDYHQLSQEICTYDIASEIDVYEIASNIDASEIAEHFDTHDLASEIEVSDLAEYVDMDTKLSNYHDELISEVEGMIEDAVSEVESSIDDLTVSRA